MAGDKNYLEAIARGIEACKSSDHAAAEMLFTGAVAECEATNGPEHLDTAVCLDHLASALTVQARYAEAEVIYKRSASIRTKRCPEIVRQAFHLQSEGRYSEAELLFRDALAICEKAVGPEHKSTAACLDNVATVCRIQSRFTEALPLCQRALSIREKALGQNSRETAASYSNLGWLHRFLANGPEAERLLEKALRIRESVLGEDHLETAESCDRLAALRKDQGRHAEAESLCRRGLAIRKKHLGPDHHLTAASLNNLGSVYQAGSEAEARKTHASPRQASPRTTATPAIDRPPDPANEGKHASPPKTSPFAIPLQSLSSLWDGSSEIFARNGNVRSVAEAFEAVVPHAVRHLNQQSAPRKHWLIEAGSLMAIVVALACLWWIGWKIVWIVLHALLPWIGLLTAIGLFVAIWYVVVFLKRTVPLQQDRVDDDATPVYDFDGIAVNSKLCETEAKTITVDQAKSLARQSIVHLNGLRSLSRGVARELAKQNGLLSLNGLTTLSNEAAQELSKHCGSLYLDGVTSLSEDAANILRSHKGRVSLRGLADASE